MSYDVLIVEDDHDIRFYLELCLSEEGIRCISAGNGAIALELLEAMTAAELPSLAIVDVMMPILDGPGFVRELQNRDLAPKLRVVMATSSLTAPKVEFFGRHCLVLSKPLDIDKLIIIIKQNLESLKISSVSL